MFFIYSFSIWVLYIIGTWVGLYATQGTAQLGIQDAITALAFASIGMIITPGGIGAYAFLWLKFWRKVVFLLNWDLPMALYNGLHSF